MKQVPRNLFAEAIVRGVTLNICESLEKEKVKGNVKSLLEEQRCTFSSLPRVHAKPLIIDDTYLVIGSFNWLSTQPGNAIEHSLFIPFTKSPPLIQLVTSSIASYSPKKESERFNDYCFDSDSEVEDKKVEDEPQKDLKKKEAKEKKDIKKDIRKLKLTTSKPEKPTKNTETEENSHSSISSGDKKIKPHPKKSSS